MAKPIKTRLKALEERSYPRIEAIWIYAGVEEMPPVEDLGQGVFRLGVRHLPDEIPDKVCCVLHSEKYPEDAIKPEVAEDILGMLELTKAQRALMQRSPSIVLVTFRRETEADPDPDPDRKDT